MLKLVVLVSGGGTNLQAIIDGVAGGSHSRNTEIVGRDQQQQECLCACSRAEDHNIPAACVSPKDYADPGHAFNQALLERIQSTSASRISSFWPDVWS